MKIFFFKSKLWVHTQKIPLELHKKSCQEQQGIDRLLASNRLEITVLCCRKLTQGLSLNRNYHKNQEDSFGINISGWALIAHSQMKKGGSSLGTL